VSIRCRSDEDEEDSVYSNYKEKKLYIHEENVGNKGGDGGVRNRNRERVIGKIRPESTVGEWQNN
jgi:hypothetical protein